MFTNKARLLFVLVVTILIVLPFSKWYFFLLDDFSMFPYRELAWGSLFDMSFSPILFIWNVVSLIIPGWIIQKLFYITTLMLLGIAWLQLFRKSVEKGVYLAGLLIVFNPFVYSRVLDGQIGIVMSVALLALGTGFFIRYIESKELKQFIYASIIWALSIMWMPHALFFVFSALGVFLFFDWFNRKDIWFAIRTFLISSSLILILNANWIIWSIWKNGWIGTIVNQIWSGHFQAFSTDPGTVWVYFNTLSLHGFWGEREGRYLSTYFDTPNWIAVFLVIFALVAYGVYVRIIRQDAPREVADKSFLTLGIIAYILALGISGNNIFAPITQFLYDYIPFYKGLREPQKWVGVLLIAYAYFGGHAVESLYQSRFVQKGYPKLFLAGVLALPFLYTPTMLFGFQGQLRVSDYPPEWYQLNEHFATEPEGADTCLYRSMGAPVRCYDTLVFPWHMYLRLSFADRIIANPTETFFFHTRILQGDNMEIGSIYTQSTREESRIVEKYVGPKGMFRDGVSEFDTEWFITDMRWLGITRILLLKESDYQDGYLEWLSGMEHAGKVVIEENNDAYILYRMK